MTYYLCAHTDLNELHVAHSAIPHLHTDFVSTMYDHFYGLHMLWLRSTPYPCLVMLVKDPLPTDILRLQMHGVVTVELSLDPYMQVSYNGYMRNVVESEIRKIVDYINHKNC